MEINDLKEQIEKLPDEPRKPSIIDDINALRAIPARWKLLKDPLAGLRKIRDGDYFDTEEQLLVELKETIDGIDPDECMIEVTEADDPTPRLVDIPALQRLALEHTALEKKVAQYEELLADAEHIEFSVDFDISERPDGQWVQSSEHGIPVNEIYFDTALLAWNALKNGGEKP